MQIIICPPNVQFRSIYIYIGNFRRIRETIQRASKYNSDPFGNVINLSNFKFCIPVYKLLGKNLNFCPTPGTYNKNIFKTEMDQFYRRLKLRGHFGNDNHDRRTITEEDIFKPMSNWEPRQVHHTINTFCEAITRETQNQPNQRKPQNNLTKEQIEVIKELKSRDDVIITKADKGGAVVIMDVTSYIAEADRQLNNEEFYKKITHDPTQLHAERINNTIDQLKGEGLISEKVAKGLKVDIPKPQSFLFCQRYTKPGILEDRLLVRLNVIPPISQNTLITTFNHKYIYSILPITRTSKGPMKMVRVNECSSYPG